MMRRYPNPLSRPPHRLTRPLAVATLVGAFLSASVTPALGQLRLAEPTRPEAVESCVTIGVSLALFDSAAPVISIVPAYDPAAGTATVEVRRPMLVGACAEIQAFWRPAASGTIEATLNLSAVALDGSESPIGSDSLRANRSGAAHHAEELKATFAPAGAGALELVADLHVQAQSAAGTLTTDSLRMPIRIVVVDGIATGVLSGRVVDTGGRPLAGARVRAEAAGQAFSRFASPRMQFLPSTPGGMTITPPDGGVGPALSTETLTDAAGRFWLEPSMGDYRIEALAPAFERQWYNGVASRDAATLVALAGGAVVTGIDFALQPAPPTSPTPTPGDRPVELSGRVTNDQGEPIAGAQIWFFSRGQAPGGDSWKYGGICCTDADGSYRIRSLDALADDPRGEVLVSAHAEGYQRAWYRGATSPYNAQVLAPRPDQPATADLVLDRLPTGIVRGLVTRLASMMVGYPVRADGSIGDPSAMAFYDHYANTAPRESLTLHLLAGLDAVFGEPPFRPYSLHLPPGRYIIGGAENWRADVTEGRSQPGWWWPGVADPQQATVIQVITGQAVEGIDFNP